ncbi:hypothetical protein SODALDRAFT_327351 [Sodiomyces alkalinus F11]|uniref:Uncharacterized protein n=1 Tax=Sodiomyces alkalinus (strain CBS 110278 / VKM F-3762 / F11) TaxID=1314773 RepID=A0A3N2Q8S1_SODAK|nr:hypothetical protein SODALDRAFT_327351 [Sodiomyces alkalinus F11]ROT43173.1 hypothetical protein SODALDRAFT_327351 [Sodiomyces alkalinus F11]
MTLEEFATVAEPMARGRRQVGHGGSSIDDDEDEDDDSSSSSTTTTTTTTTTSAGDNWWWHFQGRIPDVTVQCMRVLRSVFGENVRVSVEIEKPGRAGLRELAAEADVVFYSRSWAEVSDSNPLPQNLPDCPGWLAAPAC